MKLTLTEILRQAQVNTLPCSIDQDDSEESLDEFEDSLEEFEDLDETIHNPTPSPVDLLAVSPLQHSRAAHKTDFGDEYNEHAEWVDNPPIEPGKQLWQVYWENTAGTKFTAGLVVHEDDQRVLVAAPILRRLMGARLSDIKLRKVRVW